MRRSAWATVSSPKVGIVSRTSVMESSTPVTRIRSDKAPGARLRSISATWLVSASVTVGDDPTTVTRMMEPVSPLPCPDSGTDDTAAEMAADALAASIPSASTVRSNAGRWATG